MRNILKVFLFMLIIIEGIQAKEHVFTFGKDHGDIFYSENGQITTRTTNLNIRVPDNIQMTYIKVVVYSIPEPKVSYDYERRTVNIAYSWYQLPLGWYELRAKGEVAT